MTTAYRIGVIGLGHMGRRYAAALEASPRWQLAAVADLQPAARAWAAAQLPGVYATADAAELVADPSLDALVLATLADARPDLLTAALGAGKHVIAEKPLAAAPALEWELLQTIEASPPLIAVNLFNRSAWFHHALRRFVAAGEIGDLALIRINHETPGLMPTEGHAPEGPPFHDCGMHYVDVARWYAGSEYDRWHAQGLRMWDWPEPWWVTAHGTFANGVVFQISNGFVYGQLAQTKTEHCGIELVGTLGLARLRHDFHTVTIDYHGVSTTEQQRGDYGGKHLDVLVDTFARSIDAGHNLGFPTARDSVVASQIAQQMLDAAAADRPPQIGTQAELERILVHRAALREHPEGIHPSIVI